MNKSSSTKSICIVIPTFNRVSYLRILLKQLESQQINADFKLLPLIVVDGSNDGTYEMLANEFPQVQVLKGPGNWWWTKCMNEGMKYAIQELKPDYFLMLNDDSQVDPNYINELTNALTLTGDNCIIGSISVTDKAPYRVSFAGIKKIDWLRLKKQAYHTSFELLQNIPASGLYPTYALNGRGTLVKSSLIQDLDFLNERAFPQYGSDDDLALRAWKKGYKVLISYACKIIDRTNDTSKGTAFRQDSVSIFIKSFFTWNSVNYIPKQLVFFYTHGIKVLLPFYFVKFILGTSYAYFFKYKRLKYEL